MTNSISYKEYEVYVKNVSLRSSFLVLTILVLIAFNVIFSIMWNIQVSTEWMVLGLSLASDQYSNLRQEASRQLQEHYSRDYDFFFMIICFIVCVVSGCAAIFLAEQKSIGKKVVLLEGRISDAVLRNACMEGRGLKVAKTLGKTCVSLRRNVIFISPDDLFMALNSEKFARKVLRHEMIHARAFDPGFTWIISANSYLIMAPIFLILFLMFGSGINALIAEINLNYASELLFF